MQRYCGTGVLRHANAVARGYGRSDRFGLRSTANSVGHVGHEFCGRVSQAKNLFQGANAGARIFGGMGQKTKQKAIQVKGVRDE